MDINVAILTGPSLATPVPEIDLYDTHETPEAPASVSSDDLDELLR